jgi:serine protease
MSIWYVRNCFLQQLDHSALFLHGVVLYLSCGKLQPYSADAGNIAGAEFGIPEGQFWHNPQGAHGTHVAGTIAAQGGNDEGVVGVIPSNQGICLLIARIFDDTEQGQSTSVIYQGIEWCAENGARVISLSLGGPGFDEVGQELTTALTQNENILVVAAAGNDGTSSYSYPASYPDVISVAAVDEGNNPAGFSQFNDQVDLAAPGVNIESTVPGNSYASLQGTSMATPHVTAAIAKVWAARPQCTNQQVREAVERSAFDLLSAGKDDSTGYGLVQVAAAYQVRNTLLPSAFCVLQRQGTHTISR